MSERFVCVHAHFYQPPRENPWSGEVEREAGAEPYHDWNERITAECYAPNGAVSLSDAGGAEAPAVNNYGMLSFDAGPTLLAWLDRHAPRVVDRMLEGDRLGAARFSGHGGAIAHPRHHVILPLANARDRRTQVRWGTREFEWRFGRRAAGMWLPETAVDLATLETLVDEGIRFTILAPHQAARIRGVDGAEWQDVGPRGVDSTRPYVQVLPSGHRIALFFYDSDLSREVSFGRVLDTADGLSARLIQCVGAAGPHALIHLATDGETFGHHHAKGARVLARALTAIDSRGNATLSCYAEQLARRETRLEVQIREQTSWSCEHGVERWRADCGCHTGERPDWSQGWRAPLRQALDDLAARLADGFDREGRRVLADPWAARDDYIECLLDPRADRVESWFACRASDRPVAAGRKRALALLEMQRMAMAMFTSCGWFFDDPSGIETTQILLYAGRSLELAESLGIGGARPRFLSMLGEVRSNGAESIDGARLFEVGVARAKAAAARRGR